MPKSRLDYFKDTFSFLNDIYSINKGGCCYVAYILAENLEKLHIPYKVIINNDCMEDTEIIYTNAIKDRSRYGIFGHKDYSCSHIWIKTSFGILNDESKYYRRGKNIELPINSKDLLWLYKKGSWNSTYKTKNNHLVKEIINSIFEKLWQLKRRKSKFLILL